jgi:hypothetical protein
MYTSRSLENRFSLAKMIDLVGQVANLRTKVNLSAAKMYYYMYVLAADIFLSPAKIVYLNCILAVDKIIFYR